MQKIVIIADDAYYSDLVHYKDNENGFHELGDDIVMHNKNDIVAKNGIFDSEADTLIFIENETSIQHVKISQIHMNKDAVEIVLKISTRIHCSSDLNAFFSLSDLICSTKRIRRREIITLQPFCAFITSLSPLESKRRAKILRRALCAWVSAALHPSVSREASDPEANVLGALPDVRRTCHWLESTIEESDDKYRIWEELSIKILEKCDSGLQIVSQNLCLNGVEIKILLLALAPDISIHYQNAYSIIMRDSSKQRPTLAVIQLLLGESECIRAALTGSRLLSMGVLVGLNNCALRLTDPVEVDPALLGLILSDSDWIAEDGHLKGVLRNTQGSGALGVVHSDVICDSLLEILRHDAQGRVHLLLGDPAVWVSRIERSAFALARPVLHIDADALAALSQLDAAVAISRILRASALARAVLILEVRDPAPQPGDSLSRLIDEVSKEEIAGPLLVVTRSKVVEAACAGRAQRILREASAGVPDTVGFLVRAAGAVGFTVDLQRAEGMLRGCRVSEPAILNAIEFVHRMLPETASEADKDRELRAALLKRADKEQVSFSRKLDGQIQLSDLVLPTDGKHALTEILNYRKHARTVLDDWGFGYGKATGRGVSALFSGPSGTGKTMAAQALSCEAKAAIYQVDISKVISKYIGETEKNLDMIFDEASRYGVILLFDEADALFGKRGEVRDAHDRYANMEVAFLLQRIEVHQGLCILTTNLRQNIDAAFLRRFQFVVDFPMPNATAREEIWLRCLPESAPLAPDVNVKVLARRLEVSGGSIREITLRAAYLAASDGTAISMKHLVAAAGRELTKLGMAQARRDLELQFDGAGTSNA
ncbi:MAG TPA: hypothetical protein DCL48_11200 [Alphaproteobacteria bacterium]|nr:hypothetical protein [Alphaproteobacteria bacterium]